jgi:uncharacterized protein YndB with AHSA1/START domain
MNDTATNLGEVTYTRVWEAPVALVFDCLTTPEHLSKFWGPTGVSTPIDNITVEPRVGGNFITIMVDDASGAEYPSAGVYTEFDKPHRLAWTEPDVEGGMTTTITFTDLGDDRTETVTVQTNVPEQFRTEQAQAGMLTSFDKMAAYMATL